ncbi:exonuclease 1-like [Branchiostoma floridae]|uniref:Exonuclease 1 n=1 Tax=Branchiostoma floridae TaxID=7739 RepID=A0A9J7N9J8_BRAFL|nr:exonuclease 1-like [Branchiostoma floridae]
MGITGLLPELKKSTEPINIEDMTGTVVAIDASCWLHSGLIGCAKEVFLGRPVDSYIRYFMGRIEILLRNGVTPLVVFDGRNPLPAKAELTAKRKQDRQKARTFARFALMEKNTTRFDRNCQDGLEVKPEMVDNVIKALKDRGVDYLMAPYEADPQLAFMSMSGAADYVITEDSDLLVYGAKKVIYKWDGHDGQLILHHHLYRSYPDFPQFTFEKFQHMCIISGCDYLGSIESIGLKRAATFVKSVGDGDIFKQIKNIGRITGRSNITVPPGYPEKLKMAVNTFTHQTVFHPDKGYVPLHDYPPGMSAVDMEYAGLPPSGAPIADLSRTWISEQMLNRTDQTDKTFEDPSSDTDSTTSNHYNLRSQQQAPVSTVFSIGEGLQWTPPCFPVMTLDFVTGTLSSEHNTPHSPCLFKASDHRVLLETPPFDITIQKSCTIKHESQSYIVVWEWDFFSLPDNYSDDIMSQFSQATISSGNTPEDAAYTTDQESDDSDSDSGDDDGEHEIAFKVMGVTKKLRRQEVLVIGRKMTQPPTVDIIPDPDNFYDANAIAVRLHTDKGPEIVGYIVTELTQYVHPLLNTDRLVCVRAGNITLRTEFLHPGYYMKLLITKKGKWEPAVVKASQWVK